MAYRDVRLTCPRCHVELERKQRRDAWRCRSCRGVALDTGELVRKLHLLGDRERDVPRMFVRKSREKLACIACHAPMQAVTFHHVGLHRCRTDQLLWFDASALDRVLDAVIEAREARRSWLQRLLDSLFAN